MFWATILNYPLVSE